MLVTFLFLLLNFFLPMHGSNPVISAEEFLRCFDKRFKGEPFEFTNQSTYSDNLITIHIQKPNAGLESFDISVLCAMLTGGKGRELVSTFKVDDPHRLLMHEGSFSPGIHAAQHNESIKMRRAIGGTRTVGIYEHADTMLCFKQWPEAPGIEVAAHAVFKAIFQARHEEIPIPPAEVILMNGQAFLVSKFMGDESFEDVLMGTPSASPGYTFNLEKFQRLAIFCWLTVPEDCGARNCRVRKMAGSHESEFVLIDNERSFGREITEGYLDVEEGNIHTRCHCVLFCFDEMLGHKIKESVFNEVMSKKNDILVTWARILKENSYQLALTELIHESDQRKTILGIPFDETNTINMLSRVNKFIKAMSEHREDSLASIFQRVAPELAAIYRVPVPDAPVPEPAGATNLTKILQRLYIRDPERVPGSSTPASALVPLDRYLGSTNISLQTLLNVMTWVSRNCDVLDEREKRDTDSIISVIQFFLLLNSTGALNLV